MKFYMVIAHHANSTSKRHETFDKAIEEATRLTRLEGKDFYILESTHIVRTVFQPVEVSPIKDNGL